MNMWATSRLLPAQTWENLIVLRALAFEQELLYISLLFSHQVMSEFLQPHGQQHARLPCPSPSPRQHWTLLSWPDTSTTEHHFCFDPAASFFLELLVIALHSYPVAYWTPSGRGLGRELIFWCHIFLPFHTLQGVLVARILEWFAIPSSSGLLFVRALHCDPSVWGGPAWHTSASLSYVGSFAMARLWSLYLVQFSSVQSLSHVQLFATPWTAAHQASLSITNSQSLLKLMSIELVMPSNHLILCHSLLLLPSIFPSIRVFSNESVLHIRWRKYWSFSFNISPSNEYSGLISPCSPRDAPESSPTPQFKSINSLAFSFH